MEKKKPQPALETVTNAPFSRCIGSVIMDDDQVAVMGDFNASIKALCDKVEDIIGKGRARSMALTKIQEASMHINNALSRDGIRKEKENN